MLRFFSCSSSSWRCSSSTSAPLLLGTAHLLLGAGALLVRKVTSPCSAAPLLLGAGSDFLFYQHCVLLMSVHCY
ncbi:hypothetical protein Ahy_A09g044849 isoform D [Arachis hypogaea]|uniref:Uncharacterized protein n=1 Tax=Arachis hypogaea TaxID=3818 RepID=A0A445BL02_ARAHY|nr:hypothetical protein Ahy_A09g044849 isoform D [Arachis hypogaea]